MKDSPLVSVVMPTYNDAPYLREAIDSVLNQTYPHFEFIIVNDGSTDETEAILKTYTDPRIRYFRNEANRGNNFTRNRGMMEANGEYIAIMDSDDISVPERLDIQLSYLESNPDVDILGGFTRSFSAEGYSKVDHFAVGSSFLKAFLFFKNSVAQPTVMLRSRLLERGDFKYEPEREYMGDYHLWYRSVKRGLFIKSLPTVLVHYRLSPSQIGNTYLEERNRKLKNFLLERLNDLGIQLPENEAQQLFEFLKSRTSVDFQAFRNLKKNLGLIERQNKKYGWARHKSMKAALLFFRLRLIKYYYLENGRRAKFLLSLFQLMIHAGPAAFAEFWRNEGKYWIKQE